MSGMWQRYRCDVYAAVFLSLIVASGHLPEVVGLVKGNPIALFGGVTEFLKPGWLPGYSYIDPNIGQTSQAWGRRAAYEWIAGRVPWWNPYAGVGIPLGGDMISAAFFPPTFFYFFDHGHLYIHIFLQFTGGIFTYILLRQLRLSRMAAFVGGSLYALNGTFAWFAHASFNPVAFLPVMLVGVESAKRAAIARQAGGWCSLALGLTLSLYAGFPETAYISGLLVAVWTLLRGIQLPRVYWISFSQKIITGGVVGLSGAAPLLAAFLSYLPQAYLGTHTDGGFAYAHLGTSALPTLIVPYLYGNIFAPAEPIEATYFWGNVGGYLGTTVFVLLVVGLPGRRERTLRWMLGGWMALTLGKTFGIGWVTELFNLLPFIKDAAFYRYAPPSWEMAAVVLAAFALDDLTSNRLQTWWYYTIPLVVMALTISLVFLTARPLLTRLAVYPDFWMVPCFSVAWTTAVILFIPIAVTLPVVKFQRLALAIVAVADALLLFLIPRFANPREYRLNLGGVEFLQKNLGLQRFYSLGPIAPNYATYFGVASINHIDVPIPARWTNYIAEQLDSNNVHGSNFLGTARKNPQGPTAADELVRNLTNYEAVGVKYVVAPAGDVPFLRTITFGSSLRTGNVPLPINNGDVVSGQFPGVIPSGLLVGVQVFVGTYGGHATGMLKASLQTASGFEAEAVADVTRARDNQFFTLLFPQPFLISAPGPAQFRFEITECTSPLALWRFPPVPGEAQALRHGHSSLDGYLAIRLLYQQANNVLPEPVYQDNLMSIYELPAPKSYFETVGGSCTVQIVAREAVNTTCEGPASLIRRELFFPGWRATVNGTDTAITIHDNLFQQIAIPAGPATISFDFRPPHVEWAMLAAAIALCFLLWHGVLLARRLE